MAYYLQKIAPRTVRSDATMLLSPTSRVGSNGYLCTVALYKHTCGIVPLTGKLDACESLQENWYSLHSWTSLLHVEKERNRMVKTQSAEKGHHTSRHHFFSKYDGSILSFRHSLKTSR
ncbi:hypothetical protein JG688_00007616 [Phytophthora aleatoria]|uniref:Uncharacterized protein n=1 Tax=Phytophthora aleatoria TaxID=2496075 RepID=A0A8J5IS47_9STRA|nr:hypothetical protein JG688_00007616 [Phytophthora aleatoria]